ncbi:MAG: helix-turn-helix transcriptional regulator [Clostridia bacterium]|nr:helix-turn-helix transcriptional regulator [Clostridia bacterium]
MNHPSEFGILLKEFRQSAGYRQSELALEIKKSTQYISNIENGKNNSPPKKEDLDKLIEKLDLKDERKRKFILAASADRRTLPDNQIEYILSHDNFIELIEFATNNDIPDKKWNTILNSLIKKEK